MSETEPDHDEQPLMAHLLELRTRVIRIVIGIGLVFVPCFYFSRPLFTFLSGPLLVHMPGTNSLIATGVTAPFLVPMKLSIMVAFAISLPWTLYQVWMFIAPGLYLNERRLVTPLLVSSTLLFYLGMAFAYFVIFPIVFGFFISVAPTGVSVMTDISSYLDFVLKMFMAFGMAFEMPVAIFLIVWAGFSTPQKLGSYRAYVMVAAFAVGMLLTPPDVISQTLLAVPVYLLYELGIITARLFAPNGRRPSEESEGDA
ncbi:twin-arginine translocase subunit TatC [Salinisphaera sp. Q1T1-3]|uniref:twin-arginine translocase subunit TatC n=1 Tax=Salinisphaera sp. Q1T1-3 TaxID=2321229 RepID=UPI000E747DD8|nr:twin-arginine translocase subunit TatC [Salinisphaera sp. Q1T1-3]RJS94253.1 twin-arginine translocase subunit TatC [Salinisphaera sp. Q1T1-3]